MSTISILCLVAALGAVLVPACDAGSSSQTSNDTQLGAEAGEGNSDGEASAAGASGEGGAAGGQATDHTVLCEQLSEVQCKQFYTCFTAADLASDAGWLGTTEADCVALFNTANCTGAACPNEETFMPRNMNECVADFRAMSCAEFAAIANRAAANPVICASICE